MIVLSLARRDPESVRRILVKPPSSAGAVEVRLDRLKARNPERWMPSIRQAGKPIIVTCRRKADGGGYAGTEPDRRKLLQAAARAGADYIDVEAGSALARDPDLFRPARVLLSRHWRRRTPPLGELRSHAAEMARSGASAIKLVTHAADPAAMLTIRRLLAGWKGRRTPMAAFAMGEAGKASRILTLAWGGWATYVGMEAGEETASGQLSLAEAADLYRVSGIDDRTILFGITGDPVGHSLSPLMHNEAFRRLGMNCRYLPLEARSIRSLPALMKAIGIRGISVTAPHKVRFYRKLNRVEPQARLIGAVNTVLRDRRGLIGFNTDAEGLMRAVRSRLEPEGRGALILGAGGAARAAAFALQGAGAEVAVASRREAPARRLAAAVGCRHVRWNEVAGHGCSILVNATPSGSDGMSSPLSPAGLGGELIVDLNYIPGGTPLLRAARARGIRALGGEEILLQQGFAQFSIFTGRRPPENVMRRAVVRALMEGEPRAR